MATPDLQLTFRDGGTGDAGDPYTGLDRFGRLVETLWRQAGSGEARVQSQYGRNEVGGVVWRKDEQAHAQDVPTEDNYFWYDALQQVKERQRGNLTGTAPDYTGIDNLQQEEDWAYDATGNWTSYSNPSPVPAHTQTRTQNTANEITEIARASGGATVEPSYDPAGNMLTLPKEPGISTDQYALKWDAWNRLVSVKDGSTNVASYTYDGLTRRLTKTNAAAETRHYFYNNQWRALEERVEGVSGVDRQYTWGLRDRWDLLRRKRSVSGLLDETLYILKDYLDPVAIVDDSGDVKERYSYDAFGNVRFLAPDYSTRTTSAFDWGFLFHAEFRDTDTQLYNYGYRYYDVELGRWLSRDPVEEKDGTHLYAMLRNRIIYGNDYLGMGWIRMLNAGPRNLEDGLPGYAIEFQNIYIGDVPASVILQNTPESWQTIHITVTWTDTTCTEHRKEAFILDVAVINKNAPSWSDIWAASEDFVPCFLQIKSEAVIGFGDKILAPGMWPNPNQVDIFKPDPGWFFSWSEFQSRIFAAGGSSNYSETYTYENWGLCVCHPPNSAITESLSIDGLGVWTKTVPRI